MNNTKEEIRYLRLIYFGIIRKRPLETPIVLNQSKKYKN